MNELGSSLKRKMQMIYCGSVRVRVRVCKCVCVFGFHGGHTMQHSLPTITCLVASLVKMTVP